MALATSAGLAETSFQRTVTQTFKPGGLEAAQRNLLADLERQYLSLRSLTKLVLAMEGWREGKSPEIDQLSHQKIALEIDFAVEGEQTVVHFTATYEGGGLEPVVHPVVFPLADEIPAAKDVLSKLDDEWKTMMRVLTIQGASTSVTGRETLRVPPAFVQAASGGDIELEAHQATAEEGRSATERYLDRFRFPFDVEQGGCVYSFAPGVEMNDDETSIRLIMTLMAPPQGTGAVRTTTRDVDLPLTEIYVHDGELNHKTQEGVLVLVKGLCRSLAREIGITEELDFSRPR